VDDEFLAAAKAVEAGTFEGGMWRAWKELRTREKRRERGQDEPDQPAVETVAWKRRSHGDKGRGLAKARGWSCGCGMNNHIARGSCRKCSAARPGSAPIPTREEYDEYEKHTSKKKGGKKRKWENKGWKTAAEQRGGELERDPSADAPAKKRRRRQEYPSGSQPRPPTAGEQAAGGRTVRSGAGKARTPYAHGMHAVVPVVLSALVVAGLRFLRVTTEAGAAVVTKLSDSIIAVIDSLERVVRAAGIAVESWCDAIALAAPYVVGGVAALTLQWAFSKVAQYRRVEDTRTMVQVLQVGRERVTRTGRDMRPPQGPPVATMLALPSSPAVDFGALREKAKRLGVAATLAPATATAAPPVGVEYRTANRTIEEAVALAGARLAVGLGTVTHLMEASESQRRAVEAVQQARSEVRVAAYTFDAAELVAALVGARHRGVQVRVLADRKFSLSGRCRNQQASLSLLQAEGVVVKVMSGLPGAAFGGIHHAKTVLADGSTASDPFVLVVGSCNFTTASLGNMETGVRISLSERGAVEASEMFDLRFAKAEDFRLAVLSAAQRAAVA
jgi:hypothetical protein